MVTKRRKKIKLKGNIYLQKYTTKRLIYYRDSCILNSKSYYKMQKKKRERETDIRGKTIIFLEEESKLITSCFDKEKLDI